MSRDLRKLAETMRMVAADCAEDATKLDSTPFTPKGIGSVLGEHLAMIATVAQGIAIVADELDELTAREA